MSVHVAESKPRMKVFGELKVEGEAVRAELSPSRERLRDEKPKKLSFVARPALVYIPTPHLNIVLPLWRNGNTIPAMKTLTIKVPDDLFAEIASAAQIRKIPKSEIVRERLLGKAASAGTSKNSLWNRMQDLVIATDSLPADLSSNKAHFKGYGEKRPH